MFVVKAAVVGAGTMGGQIAFTIADAGIPVVLKDLEAQLVQAGLDEARSSVAGARRRGQARCRRARGAALALITAATDLSGFGDVDFVVEAVPERMEIKQAVFSELDEATPATPSSPPTPRRCRSREIGEATIRPDRWSASTSSIRRR